MLPRTRFAVQAAAALLVGLGAWRAVHLHCMTCIEPLCEASMMGSAADCFARVNEPLPEFIYERGRNRSGDALGAGLKEYLASMNVSLPLIVLGGTGGSGSRVFARLVGDLPGVVLAYNTYPELDFLLADGLHYTAKRLASSHGDPCIPGSIEDMQRSARALAAAAAAHAPRRRRVLLAVKHGSMLTNAAVFAQLLGRENVAMIHYIRDGRDLAWSANRNQLSAYANALSIPANLPDFHAQGLLWARLNKAARACLPSITRYFRAVYHHLEKHTEFAKRFSLFLKSLGVGVDHTELAYRIHKVYEAARYPTDPSELRVLESNAEFSSAQCELAELCS